MWWRIRAAWEALIQEYEEPRQSGVYDLEGNFLRPFTEQDREAIRKSLWKPL